MKEKIARVSMTLFGVLIAGFAAGFFKYAQFGSDPFQSFMNGIHTIVPVSFGLLYIILNAVLLLIIFIVKKHYIGIGTILNLFLIGYLVEFVYINLQVMIPEPSLTVRIIFLTVGFFVLCLASSFWIAADLGVSTYDAISLIMADKKIARFQYCRIVTDIVCVTVGLFLGAVLGIGTVITAFFMGPFIAFFKKHVTDPLLKQIIS